jgi:hypothetical protein
MARQVAEDEDLPDTLPWGSCASMEDAPVRQDVDNDDLPDTQSWDPQMMTQSTTDDIAVSYEIEETMGQLVKPQRGSKVQDKVLEWRDSLREEPAMGGPDEWRAEAEQSRRRVNHTTRTPVNVLYR